MAVAPNTGSNFPPASVWRQSDPVPDQSILEHYRANLSSPEQLTKYLEAVEALRRANRSIFDDPTFLKNAAATIIAGLLIVSFTVSVFWPLGKERIEIAGLRAEKANLDYEVQNKRLTAEKESLISQNDALAADREKLTAEKKKLTADLADQVAASAQAQKKLAEELEQQSLTEAEKRAVQVMLDQEKQNSAALQDSLGRLKGIDTSQSTGLQARFVGTVWATTNANFIGQLTRRIVDQEGTRQPPGTPFSARLFFGTGGLLVYQAIWKTNDTFELMGSGTWVADGGAIDLTFSNSMVLRIYGSMISEKDGEPDRFRIEGLEFQRKRSSF